MLGGVWDRREVGGSPRLVCSVVTCPPNALIAPMHDRMPVILEAVDVERWLSPADPEADTLDLARPAAGVLVAHEVATDVNRFDAEGAHLVDRLGTTQARLF